MMTSMIPSMTGETGEKDEHLLKGGQRKPLDTGVREQQKTGKGKEKSGSFRHATHIRVGFDPELMH